MKKIYASQILVIVFGVLVCISTVIPAAEILGQEINLLKPDDSFGSGIILIVLSLLAILSCLLKKKILTIVFSVLNLAIAIFQYQSFEQYMEFATTGMYLMIIASVLLFAGSIFMAIQVPKKISKKLNEKFLFPLRLNSLLKLKN